ncbi:MAG: hypothetical protein DMF06_05715 [Verrucomicrobia bacterium]|nr:MAG: hypothetical protein DMF06_05715 [Verrucomicrobiota bacterium]
MFKKLLSHFTLPLLLLFWSGSSGNADPLVPGPDVITGDMGMPAFEGLAQFGSSGTQVGLGMATSICNAGNVPVDVFEMPATNHAVIPQNLYRMSGGAENNDRFEQLGHSWVKHMFGANNLNECGFGCATTVLDPTHLDAGCSDIYQASQNATADDLSSRAWVNPFTGAFQSNSRDHTGHTHTGTSHRLLVESNDLNTTLNPGATYYAEVQFVVPHEYTWCQTHPGECNMYNNASYRQFNVSGTTSFSFAPAAPAVRMTPAINAWSGATINPIEPQPGIDGRGFIAYKVTNPSAGIWHYEYAIYNMNLDRGIQSFSVPLCGTTASNLGFHAPPNHPGFPNDGTVGDAGFSNAPWTSIETGNALIWSTETFAQNQNANAIRWGTLYNFRFDSTQPPQPANATVGFFKTGTSMTVAIQGPSAICNATPTPSPTPSPTPPGTAQAINLSTRMRVQIGDNAGIGGFILTGSAPTHVLLRALGPSLAQAGVPNVLADPVMELHGPGAFVTITDDNWRDDPAQQAAIIASGIPPTNNLEAAIDATLNPGAYTAVVRGKNNGTGVALVEVYDLNAGALSKLANISTRALVSTGTDIVIAGFTLGSHRDGDRIVVRGIGPSLTALGVAGALANPMLELRDSNGAVLASNNDWQDNPTQAAELTAAGLAPTNNLESGIAATLPAGLYTALLSGMNNGVGVGLVEVYDRGMP